MWPFSSAKKPIPDLAGPLRDLSARFDDLERSVQGLDSDLDWLAGEVKKLRGKITGGRRGNPAGDAPSDVGEHGPPAAPYSPQWFAEQRRKLLKRG